MNDRTIFKEKRIMKKWVAANSVLIISMLLFSLLFSDGMFTPASVVMAADYSEELEWSQLETSLLDGNPVEWSLDLPSNTNKEIKTVKGVSALYGNLQNDEKTENLKTAAMISDASKNLAKRNQYLQSSNISPVEILPVWRISITEEELELLEKCVMAEGGGESYECQLAIANVIINRVLDKEYPNTVKGVITQKGQFSSWPKMVKKAAATDSVKLAVRESLTKGCLPEDVLFFRANDYHTWGTSYCRIDNTYFSTP